MALFIARNTPLLVCTLSGISVQCGFRDLFLFCLFLHQYFQFSAYCLVLSLTIPSSPLILPTPYPVASVCFDIPACASLQDGRLAGDVAVGRALSDAVAAVPRLSSDSWERLFHSSTQVRARGCASERGTVRGWDHASMGPCKYGTMQVWDCARRNRIACTMMCGAVVRCAQRRVLCCVVLLWGPM